MSGKLPAGTAFVSGQSGVGAVGKDMGLYNNYTICGNTGSDKVISYQYIVISAGGPHQTGWRAIFIHNAPEECLNPYIKGPPPL